MKAVVMAGGFGTRIQPLTHSIPKPMLPILNRPMMQHIIEKLRDAGIKDIVILLYFKPEIIKDYFKDGSWLGVNIEYVLPDDDYGTAGAVKCAEYFLNEEFIIVSGDLVTDFDISEIMAFHKKKSSKLTITLTPVADPLQFGVVIASPEGKIQRFLEKPSWGEVFSDTINTGIYVLDPEILEYIPEHTNFDFAKDLFPLLMKEDITLWACSMRGYWRDVGNPESYRDVQKDLLSGKVELEFRGSKHQLGNGVIYAEDGAKIPKEGHVDGIVVLGKNAILEDGVKLRNCIIGDDSVVKRGSELEDVAIWDNVSVGDKCAITNSVICSKNKIGKKVKVNKGLILAEGCEIGDLSSFENDVIVWAEKIIEEASIISNNVVWGSKYKNSIFEGGIVSGRTNVELSCEMAIKLAEAFGSMLPVGSKVYLTRDYHKSSRMLKRAFFSGLLSSGINVVDLHIAPSNVARFSIKEGKEVVAGVHFRQSVSSQQNTEILFFTNEGLHIDTNIEKNCERIFFRESFRRVNFDEIGQISEKTNVKEKYKKAVMKALKTEVLNVKRPKIAVDLMYGSTADVYPEILNALNIDNIVLNAYADDKKLNRIVNLVNKSQDDLSNIVKHLNMDMAYLIYPNGQKLDIVLKDGEILSSHIQLLTILKLLNLHSKDKKSKVFLPVSTPDFLDEEFENLVIERGKFSGVKANKLKEYDLIANLSGNYAFCEFAYSFDAIFTSMKILEMALECECALYEIKNSIKPFYFHYEKVPCPSGLKGKMMRKFMEESVGKEASFVDGVKINMKKTDWILMLPDQHSEHLNIYIQAKDDVSGEAIFNDFALKISEWIAEK
ncbi:MAG: sugar phosphate nucleotidyltransferase [Campylobacterales bacterium]|nr:sugar phosphate nucleotidyltransferase [Campylobacterales bacterium]